MASISLFGSEGPDKMNFDDKYLIKYGENICVNLTYTPMVGKFMNAIPNDCDYYCCGYESMKLTDDIIKNAAIGLDIKEIITWLELCIGIVRERTQYSVVADKEFVAMSDPLKTIENFSQIVVTLKSAQQGDAPEPASPAR